MEKVNKAIEELIKKFDELFDDLSEGEQAFFMMLTTVHAFKRSGQEEEAIELLELSKLVKMKLMEEKGLI